MFSRKAVAVLAVTLTLLVSSVYAQSGSFLDTMYMSKASTATTSATLNTLKDEIQKLYGVEIKDDPEVLAWNAKWLKAIKEVLAVLPKEFVENTQVISLIPSYMSIELKYNGFQGLENTAQIGQGALVPNPIYNRYFKRVYGKLPSDSDRIKRFKTILVRAMAYCFMNANPDVVSAWKSKFNAREISTKVYGPGSDKNLVIGQYANAFVVDMAFAISRYCAAGSKLRSKFPSRYDFIKQNVMDDKDISGWGDLTEIPAPASNNGNNTGNTNTNNGNGGDTGTSTDGTRPPPEIASGDYMPVVTEVGLGTATTNIPQEQQHLGTKQQTAIAELFADLPKFFSTCTEAIAYVPTSDTICAYSNESYVFITQHSWYKPSYVTLDDAARAKRFKAYLLLEMTKAFLFFHPEVTNAWKTKFKLNKTIDAKAGIVRTVLDYYQHSSWLNGVSRDRFNFIKEKIMDNKTF